MYDRWPAVMCRSIFQAAGEYVLGQMVIRCSARYSAMLYRSIHR